MNNKTVNTENLVNYPVLKTWFLNWIKTNKKIEYLKKNKNTLLKKIICEEINKKNINGLENKKFISLNTLKNMCELNKTEDSWKLIGLKKVKGKKGSVESKFKNEIFQALENERFICYFSSTKTNEKLPLNWEEEDLISMIKYHQDPSAELVGNRWYDLSKNPYIIFIERKSILITSESIFEFHETNNFSDYSRVKVQLDNVDFSIFTDKYENFDYHYAPLINVFKSNILKINDFVPKKIKHPNNQFISEINRIGINDYTKRIMAIDDKIKQNMNSAFNDKIKLLYKNDNYFIKTKSTKDILGNQKISFVENSIVNDLHFASLELFNLYIKLLEFRDSLIKKLVKKKIVELETILIEFENSYLGMSFFEQTSVSNIEEMNRNIFKLNTTTKEGMEELSFKLDNIDYELDTLNDSNQDILNNLEFNNFINLVNTYQLHKISKKKSL